MQFTIPHKFSQQQAIERVKAAVLEARNKLATSTDLPAGTEVSIDEDRWEGNTFHFAVTIQKQHIHGTVEVKDHEFFVNATLPLLMRMFEGKIKKAIEEQVAHLR